MCTVVMLVLRVGSFAKFVPWSVAQYTGLSSNRKPAGEALHGAS